jgi:hypothetical protein
MPAKDVEAPLHVSETSYEGRWSISQEYITTAPSQYGPNRLQVCSASDEFVAKAIAQKLRGVDWIKVYEESERQKSVNRVEELTQEINRITSRLGRK